MMEGAVSTSTSQGQGGIIEVIGITDAMNEGLIMFYFENTKRSGGGQVDGVDIDYANHSARVRFHDEQAAFGVIAKSPHILNGVEVRAVFSEIPKNLSLSYSDQAIYRSIKADTDKKTCNSVGSCPLPDGGILVTDWDNLRLKRLNNRHQIIDHLTMPSYPWVACYNPARQEAAVTHPTKKTIQIVSLHGGRMTKTRQIKTSCKCKGVACHQNTIFCIGEEDNKDNTISIFDWGSGERKGMFVPRLANGEQLFEKPGHIAVSDDGMKIYVANRNKGFVMLRWDGTFRDLQEVNDLYYVGGICIGDEGRLFVLGIKIAGAKFEVMYYDGDGTQLQTMIGHTELKEGYPFSVSFNKASSMLVVTKHASDVVGMFHLQ